MSFPFLGIFFCMWYLCAGSGLGEPGQAPPWVFRLEVHGAITPPMSGYIQDGIAKAEALQAGAVLLELDTPGGLLDSTREIVQAMLNSPLPIIVYTAPQGARATSAGVFIMMASDVAAMAPGTHIGAAHPVALGGSAPAPKKKPTELAGKSIMGEKAVSDAAAYIRVLAAEKGRNAGWAERAVRESVSLTSQEALAQGVVEVVAADREELFGRLQGRTLTKHVREIRLHLDGAVVREFPMGALRKILQIIANPNLLMIFMMLGIYGLMYEFSSPGVGFGAVVGVVSLILAAYAMSILPVNYAGVLLITLSVVLLALEFQIASHGLLAFGGLTLLALGSFFLFDTAQAYIRVSLEVIVSTVVATAAFFSFVFGKLVASRRLKPAVGQETIIGKFGVARERLDPKGMVFVESMLWSAESSSPLEKGTPVKVLAVQGNLLRVEKALEIHND